MLFLLGAGASAFGYFWLQRLPPEKILATPTVQREIKRRVGADNAGLVEFIPDFLGFSAPHTYLVLFLNNTELRPAGGYIGSYATLRMDKGKMHLYKVEGTEIIDKAAPREALLSPPKPLADYLKVDRWFFRDSNWSPDFSVAAKTALDFYARENGVAAHEIDTVIGVTTDVLEELLRKTGTITVQEITFTPGNVVEKLEYEVEYGYRKNGQTVAERKQILQELLENIMHRLAEGAVTNLKEYADLLQQLGRERHLMVYSKDASLQNRVETLGWSGEMATSSLDFVWWIDANLSALKTDHAIERDLSYVIKPRADGRFEATATMRYRHTGGFDWRTTRYRSYTRVFVPAGASLVTTGGDAKARQVGVEQGSELGRQWFGTFISIEPGQTKTLSYIYLLPAEIGRAIAGGHYSVIVQKQAGTVAPGLTLGLNFGKTITSAQPGEERAKWGDSRYDMKTDLRVDRKFTIGL